MLWLSKVWRWLRDNWKTVLLGVATLGIGLLVGRTLRKPQVVVNPELIDADNTRREAQKEEDARREEAARERKDAILHIEQVHADTLSNLTEKQRGKVEELRNDPDKLNEYLLNIGKEIRG